MLFWTSYMEFDIYVDLALIPVKWYIFCRAYEKYDFHLFYELQESLVGHI
jgi:hypothetical protein